MSSLTREEALEKMRAKAGHQAFLRAGMNAVMQTILYDVKGRHVPVNRRMAALINVLKSMFKEEELDKLLLLIVSSLETTFDDGLRYDGSVFGPFIQDRSSMFTILPVMPGDPDAEKTNYTTNMVKLGNTYDSMAYAMPLDCLMIPVKNKDGTTTEIKAFSPKHVWRMAIAVYMNRASHGLQDWTQMQIYSFFMMQINEMKNSGKLDKVPVYFKWVVMADTDPKDANGNVQGPQHLSAYRQYSYGSTLCSSTFSSDGETAQTFILDRTTEVNGVVGCPKWTEIKTDSGQPTGNWTCKNHPLLYTTTNKEVDLNDEFKVEEEVKEKPEKQDEVEKQDEDGKKTASGRPLPFAGCTQPMHWHADLSVLLLTNLIKEAQKVQATAKGPGATRGNPTHTGPSRPSRETQQQVSAPLQRQPDDEDQATALTVTVTRHDEPIATYPELMTKPVAKGTAMSGVPTFTVTVATTIHVHEKNIGSEETALTAWEAMLSQMHKVLLEFKKVQQDAGLRPIQGSDFQYNPKNKVHKEAHDNMLIVQGFQADEWDFDPESEAAKAEAVVAATPDAAAPAGADAAAEAPKPKTLTEQLVPMVSSMPTAIENFLADRYDPKTHASIPWVTVSSYEDKDQLKADLGEEVKLSEKDGNTRTYKVSAGDLIAFKLTQYADMASESEEDIPKELKIQASFQYGTEEEEPEEEEELKTGQPYKIPYPIQLDIGETDRNAWYIDFFVNIKGTWKKMPQARQTLLFEL